MKLKAIGYNAAGEAICKFNNKVFYVPGLIVNEEAECIVEFEKEKWGRAQIKTVLTKSHNRVLDLPKNHLEIGGYEIIHMNREEQTTFKTNRVIECFKQNAKVNINLFPMFIGKKQLRYRNKITLHDGGFFKRGTNEVIKMNDFLLTDIKPKTDLPGKVIFRKLDTEIVGIKGDKKFTRDTMFGIEFIIGLDSFYQVNKEVAIAAYSKIKDYTIGKNIIFDLYSGIGTISMIVANNKNTIYGIERNKASFDVSLLNNTKNNFNNINFVHSDVETFLEKNTIKADVYIVDPAREGLGKNVCDIINSQLPETIIYLSCNPGTQSADYNRLKNNYEIVYAQIFDMFPQTHHIENLIVLKKYK